VIRYLNNYLENNFIPCITLPRQITNHSASLIYGICVKIHQKFIQNKCSAGNMIVDIVDHLPNFTSIDIKTLCIKDRPYIKLLTQDKIEQFNQCLANEPPLISPTHLTDANTSLNILSTNYLSIFDKYFPYVRMSKKYFKDKSYITSGIKVSIRRRNKLQKKLLQKPTDANKIAWKRFRKKN